MRENLKRGLTRRHVAMITLGGSMGTGIFLSSGNAVYLAGPGGAVLAFMLIGIMIYFLMTSLGEMSAFLPVTGSFCEYCTRFVDPAFGFSMSYNYWFNWSITIAAELSAASIIMQFWFPNIPLIYWNLLFFFLLVGINFCAVQLYGEVEYYFAAIKVITVVIFILVGLLMIFGTLGSHKPYLSHLTLGDAPFHNGWYGLVAVTLVAGFSFQGTEAFGVIAGETKNPQTSIPRAIKNIFWRILLFYIFSIAIISVIIPYNDPLLLNPDGKVALSPFTIVFEHAGLKTAATVVNAVILTAILSTANASMYGATRILWYMSKNGMAPSVFVKVNKNSVPVYACLATAALGSLSFLSTVFGAETIFIWLVHLSALSGFIAWIGISISHYRFRKALLLQGKELSTLPYKAKLYPFGPIFTFIFCIFIILGQPFVMFGKLSWWTLISTYFSIPVLFLMYIGYKIYHQTRVVSLDKESLSLEKKTVI